MTDTTPDYDPDKWITELREQMEALRMMREVLLKSLQICNAAAVKCKIPLKFDIDAPHPSYEIHKIDDRISLVASQLAFATRNKMLAQPK